MTRAALILIFLVIAVPANADQDFDQCVAAHSPVIKGFDPILCYPPFSQKAAEILKMRRLVREQKMQATSPYPVDFTSQNQQALAWSIGVSCTQLSGLTQTECRSFWATIYN